jgi:glucokinase
VTAGRNLVPLADARLPVYAGIDLGGTNIKAALVDDAGRLLAFHTEPTHADRGPEDTAARMGGTVRLLAKSAGIAAADIARVGLGTPGPHDLRSGLILRAGNLPGWDNFPIRDRVAAHCGHAVTYANDANAAAYGEFWVGSGREYSSLILLTLGTGVGGGIIIGDTNVEGAHSHGSECGHVIVDTSPTARTCTFGHSGDIEAYASATALVAAAREALAAGGHGPLADAVAGGERLTPIVIARAAAAGDELARGLILDAARWLGIGVVSLMHTIDPEAVILGGAMTFGGEADPIGRAFIDRVRAEVRARAFPVPAERTVIRYAALGGDAGSIGAAGLARIDHRRGG